MKSRDTLLRLKKFQVDEKRRQVAQIEAMLADFDRMISDLDKEVLSEQQKTGISDPGHFAYSTYAKAAQTRRDNLKTSQDELKGQLEGAQAALADAFEELKKVEILEDRDEKRNRSLRMRREQSELDHIAQSRGAGPVLVYSA